MNQRFVLVTGASGGIGKACVTQLVRQNFQVFAGVHQHQDYQSLKQQAPDQVIPVAIDITDVKSIDTARELILKIVGNQGLYGLINNAGILVSQSIECLPLDQLRLQLEVNTIGAVAMIQAFLPLVRSAEGRIINLSSVSGFIAFPFMGGYCASKFALEAITDSLRQELKPWNIAVISIEPPFVKTKLWEKTIVKNKNSLEPSPKTTSLCEDLYRAALNQQRQHALQTVQQAITPKQVAKVVTHALTTPRPKTRYLVGTEARLGAILTYLPDRVRDWVIQQQFGLN